MGGSNNVKTMKSRTVDVYWQQCLNVTDQVVKISFTQVWTTVCPGCFGPIRVYPNENVVTWFSIRFHSWYAQNLYITYTVFHSWKICIPESYAFYRVHLENSMKFSMMESFLSANRVKHVECEVFWQKSLTDCKRWTY